MNRRDAETQRLLGMRLTAKCLMQGLGLGSTGTLGLPSAILISASLRLCG